MRNLAEVAAAVPARLYSSLDQLDMQNQGYGFVLNRAARYITRIYNRRLADVSLTLSQYGTLAAIAETGPVALQDLAEQLVIERSALLRMVQKLLSARFLLSMPDPSSKRRLLYQITNDGYRCLAAAAACVCEAEAEIEQRFERVNIMSVRDGLLPIADACGSEDSSTR